MVVIVTNYKLGYNYNLQPPSSWVEIRPLNRVISYNDPIY